MRLFRWEIRFGMILIVLSVALYYLHYLIFRDTHHIYIYLLGDIAFLPMEVLLVTLVIHRLLHLREKRAIMDKLNMVIGTFFNEVGRDLLGHLKNFDSNFGAAGKNLIVGSDWGRKEFVSARKDVQRYEYEIDSRKGDLESLREFLHHKRAFLVMLLENPVLLEHQTFTNVLWSVFHLADELSHRKSVRDLPQADYDHLSGDIKRVFILLIGEWLSYMQHLKQTYPYLFSIAVRTNPFDPDACVELS